MKEGWKIKEESETVLKYMRKIMELCQDYYSLKLQAEKKDISSKFGDIIQTQSIRNHKIILYILKRIN